MKTTINKTKITCPKYEFFFKLKNYNNSITKFKIYTTTTTKKK